MGHGYKERRRSSLLTGCDMIREEGVCSIGDDMSVRPFSDRWVPMPSGFSLLNRIGNTDARDEARVDELINQGR